ncbi:uncharacterized protein FIBRA_01744 [Fibroporia radiculosa]|uniref:tRNA-splicing endonuclease subunit Sen54 N-terminal domain-containing protein n=1 Tax=Fibroporia radiculosa TaxID=599839 RepID=J4HTT9_9APHY|nr:uncharacterized protein FIBRA_01744 [Fibroporia radiculosa]CCL99722.1 predicted protein [Fibroporia radiculosa]
MDDNLEKPTAAPLPSKPEDREEDEQSSGEEEDQGPDWTKLPSSSAARPVIPKRGEKDFEPNATGGSGLQRHVLDRARNAMLDALSAPRTISSKSISYAIWHPDIARAHVTVARGVHFGTMGHSVARASSTQNDTKKLQKRLELLPEEAIYLVERGAMLCWKASNLPLSETPGLEEIDGVPMSVQQAFSEMIGRDNLTLEKYQVFSYLRRLGYAVTRARPPTPDYPTPLPSSTQFSPSRSFFARLWSTVQSAFRRVARIFTRAFDWWRPLRLGNWVHHGFNNSSLFKSLRFLPAGHHVPLHIKQKPNAGPSPYEIFYNVYKPSTPFKKTAPPPPDYSVVVVDARTTSVPSLVELTALFGILPELPPPIPRKRLSYAQQKSAATTMPPQAPLPVSNLTLAQKLFQWAFTPPSPQNPQPPRGTNPFIALKTGKKMVVIAAVDAGMISFFRFGEGVFTEWPMV